MVINAMTTNEIASVGLPGDTPSRSRTASAANVARATRTVSQPTREM